MQTSHRNNRRRIAVLLFIMLVTVASFVAGAGFAGETASPKLSEYVSEGNYFTCLLPQGWNRYEAPDYSRELRKVYGIQVSQGRLGSRVEISVKYYAKDNKLQKSVEQFIKMHAQPIFGPAEGESYSPMRDILVKGAAAKTFERTKYEYEDHVYDPKSGRYYTPLHPRKLEMTERFIVIPAREGFFVLRYNASPDLLKSHEPVFENVLNSFTPQKELSPAPPSGPAKP